MGSKSITDKLDLEIQALTEAQGLTAAEGAPAASVAADPSASFSVTDDPKTPPAPTGIEPEAVSTPPVTPEPVDEPKQQKRISWKNRYTKLKSHHDASRFKDRNTISDAFARITTLERDNITLRAEVGRLNVKKPVSVADLATPEELNVIGDEGISSIDRITKRAVETAVGPLKEQLAIQEKERINANQRASQVAGQQAYDSFLDRLAHAVPNFAELDEDPGFAKYLSDPDPDSGIRRMEHFKKAEAVGDVGRVAFYFRGYEASRTPTSQQKLEAQVTPIGHGGSPPAPPQPPGEAEQLRASDYRKFMTDVTKGHYKSRKAEADALEAKYDAAFIAGTIIPD